MHPDFKQWLKQQRYVLYKVKLFNQIPRRYWKMNISHNPNTPSVPGKYLIKNLQPI